MILCRWKTCGIEVHKDTIPDFDVHSYLLRLGFLRYSRFTWVHEPVHLYTSYLVRSIPGLLPWSGSSCDSAVCEWPDRSISRFPTPTVCHAWRNSRVVCSDRWRKQEVHRTPTPQPQRMNWLWIGIMPRLLIIIRGAGRMKFDPSRHQTQPDNKVIVKRLNSDSNYVRNGKSRHQFWWVSHDHSSAESGSCWDLCFTINDCPDFAYYFGSSLDDYAF